MEITRAELYDRIWSTPMSKLAREFDISDVGLAKVCASYDIPRPPRGYWARVAAGRAAPRPPLPPALQPATEEIVRFNPERHRVKMTTPRSLQQPADPIPNLGAEEALPPVSAATLERLHETKPSAEGFVRCGSARVFSCSLGTATIERAARILGAIEHALPSIGARLKRADNQSTIGVAVGSEWIGIGITEETTRTGTIVEDPTFPMLSRHVYSYSFTGALRLTITARFNGRKPWGDGKQSRLEDKIGSVVSGLLVAAAGIQELRQREEEARRRWEEEARLAEELRERQRQRRAFREKLQQEAALWKAHREMQEYLSHLRRRAGPLRALPPRQRRVVPIG